MKKLIIDTCIGFECDEAQALAIALYAMTKCEKLKNKLNFATL